MTTVPVQTSAMNSSLVTVSPGRAAIAARTSMTLGSIFRTSSPRVTRFAIGSASQSPTRNGAVTVGWSAVGAGVMGGQGGARESVAAAERGAQRTGPAHHAPAADGHRRITTRCGASVLEDA